MTDPTAVPCRRVDDPRITQLVEDVKIAKTRQTEMQRTIDENTKLTKQVRDVIISFRVIAAVSKWLTAIGGAAIVCYHAWQRLTGRS